MILKLVYCAVADLLHEWLSTACQIALVVAIVAPLFVQLGLVNAYIGSLVLDLTTDPQILRVRQSRSLEIDEARLQELRAHPSIQFAVPNVRSIAGQVLMQPGRAEDALTWSSATVIPTAAGDPLSANGQTLAPEVRAVSLSWKAAAQLGVSAGDTVRMLVSRKLGGRDEETVQLLTVNAVLEHRLDRRATIYVHLKLIEAVERYKDGSAVPLFGVSGDRPWRPIERFSSVRAYASNLDAVADAAAFASRLMDIQFKSREAEIAQVRALEATLLTVFGVVVILAAIGLLTALVASMTAAVERKRKSAAVLSLMGFPPWWLIAWPVLQALLIALVAMLLVGLLTAAGGQAFDALFSAAASENSLVALSTWHWVTCTVAVFGSCLLPGMIAGARTASVAPSSALREI